MNNSWNCFYSGLKECAQQRTYFLGSHSFHTRGFVYRANPVGRTGDQSSAWNSDTSWKSLEDETVPMLSDIIIPLRGSDSTKVILLMMLVTSVAF